MASPCKGCSDKICRQGEKCIPQAAYAIAQDICGKRANAIGYGEAFHRERVRKMRHDKKLRLK